MAFTIDQEFCQQVLESLKQKDKVLTIQVAPAVRVAIGEEFDMPLGTNCVGKLVTALRKLGYKYVFDTNFGADITIMEEATEFVERVKNNERLPLFTTCCPSWYRFVEELYPEFFQYLSSVKSPQAILGSLVNTYLAEKLNIYPKNLVHDVVAPCLVKKFEATRREMWVHRDDPNIDHVISTRELAFILKEAKIDLPNLEESDFDHPMGLSSGGGAIFGTTGGVTEAMLRTAYYLINKKEMSDFNIKEIRSTETFRVNEIQINDELTIKLAILDGLHEAKKIMEQFKEKGELPYHIVEVMSCPEGCIGGAGQPLPNKKEILDKRRAALFDYDSEHEFKAPHQNPEIQKLYEEYIGKPNGDKAKELFHTMYFARAHTHLLKYDN